MSAKPEDSQQPAAPKDDSPSDSEGVNVSTAQEGDRNTMIANNGYGKVVATRIIKLNANQKGNDSFMSANNAESGNEEAQMQKHNEGMAIREQLQRQTRGQELGGEGLARLNLREHRVAVFQNMFSK
ncbi:hypothetical protein DPSP01_002416 [Paraphaeosphaeria sporulosa]